MAPVNYVMNPDLMIRTSMYALAATLDTVKAGQQRDPSDALAATTDPFRQPRTPTGDTMPSNMATTPSRLRIPLANPKPTSYAPAATTEVTDGSIHSQGAVASMSHRSIPGEGDGSWTQVALPYGRSPRNTASSQGSSTAQRRLSAQQSDTPSTPVLGRFVLQAQIDHFEQRIQE